MPVKPEDNRDLLRKAQQGDAEAFGRLYEQHATAIFRYLYAHLYDRQDAEDLTSDVFIKAWQTLPKYNERGIPFLAYLFRIARNRLVDHYRQKRPNIHFSPAFENSKADENPGPADTFLEKSGNQELANVLSLIKEDYRTVLVLRIINQLSPEETAKVLGRSIGAVRVLQHRALEALRQVIKGQEENKNEHESTHKNSIDCG